MKKNDIFLILYIIIIFVLLLFFINFIKNSKDYFLKVNINLDNYTALELDRHIAEDIKDKLMQIPEIKEVVIFSRYSNCSVYLKISPFVLNKRLLSYIVENRLKQVLVDKVQDAEIEFDDEFYKKYSMFLIAYSDSDYFSLKKNCDEIFDRLVELNLLDKILNLECFKKVSYIYYTSDKLLKYNMNLSDIKNFILENNILSTSCQKSFNKNIYTIDSDSDYKTIDDIKKLAVFYKDKNFSTKFNDVFVVQNEIKTPIDYAINFNDKKAQLMALSKKKFYPFGIFNYKLKKFVSNIQNDFPDINLKLIPAYKLSKIEIYFDNTISFDELLFHYKKIDDKLIESRIDDTVFLLGVDSPRISSNEKFFEFQRNKITLLVNRTDTLQVKNIIKKMNYNYILESDSRTTLYSKNPKKLYEKVKKDYNGKVVIGTDKAMTIRYDINEFNLNDYLMPKKDVVEAIMAHNDGLLVGHYRDIENDRIPIVIKNKDSDNRNYIYSKEYKTLIYLPSFYSENFVNDFWVLARKNDDYFSVVLNK